jgi:hypothetical protein
MKKPKKAPYQVTATIVRLNEPSPEAIQTFVNNAVRLANWMVAQKKSK